MNGSDIWMSLLIFFIFLLLFVFNIISVGIKKIKEDWPQYRCNPTVMPFSQELGNISASENFTYCVQNMQADYMGIILQPVNYAISLAGTLAMDLISGINAIRHMFDFLREALGGIFGKIYDTFLTLIIEFQKALISIIDMVNKMVGMMYTLMYTMEGVVHSMESGWNGPPGQMLKALGCFHPNTKVMKQDGKVVDMKSLHLGDILKNGSVVDGILLYNNVDSSGNYLQPFYEIPNGVENTNVLVTGSHLLWDGKKFEYSKNNKEAILSETKSKYFVCLCTSDNIIQLGKNKFWDYNDTETMTKDLIY